MTKKLLNHFEATAVSVAANHLYRKSHLALALLKGRSIPVNLPNPYEKEPEKSSP